jgi:hypothetical protein
VAICFVRARVLGRSGGRSAVAAAAYRSGSKITDKRTEITHDYTKKQGVDYSEIISPIPATGSNEWLNNRAELWNEVETGEKRFDAQLSREMIIAIPRELDQQQMISLVREHVQSSYVDRGMVADINLHHLDGDNPHAHVMLTMRELKIDERGTVSFGNKDRSWNDKKLVQLQKKEWEILANQYLEQAGIETGIDARSYEEQGIARIPQVHVGTAAWRLEQQGIRTAPGDLNREVAAANQAIELAQSEIVTAQKNIEIELRREIERRAAEQAAAEREAAERKAQEQAEVQRREAYLKKYPPGSFKEAFHNGSEAAAAWLKKDSELKRKAEKEKLFEISKPPERVVAEKKEVEQQAQEKTPLHSYSPSDLLNSESKSIVAVLNQKNTEIVAPIADLMLTTKNTFNLKGNNFVVDYNPASKVLNIADIHTGELLMSAQGKTADGKTSWSDLLPADGKVRLPKELIDSFVSYKQQLNNQPKATKSKSHPSR